MLRHVRLSVWKNWAPNDGFPNLIRVFFENLSKKFVSLKSYKNTGYFRQRHAVAQFVEALRYKPECHGFDSRCHWQSFRPHYGPGVDSSSNRIEYHEYFQGDKGDRCVGLTTYHLHVPTVLKSGRLNLSEPSGLIEACNGIALPLDEDQCICMAISRSTFLRMRNLTVVGKHTIHVRLFFSENRAIY